MIRTTLRLRQDLKKSLARRAIEENTTEQELFNRAVQDLLKNKPIRKKKIDFPTFDLGAGLDNLTREDFYGDDRLG